MRLIIDFGNTLSKVALYENDKMLTIGSFSNLTIMSLKAFTNEFLENHNKSSKISHCIVSSVIDYPIEIQNYLQSNFSFLELQATSPLPVKIGYKTPGTLGNDRIAAVIAGNSIFPEQDILIIDVGTCITYDFLNSKGEYLGGSISPGFNLRFKALNNYTGKLPLINNFGETAELIGNSTANSIKSGVINGVKAEVNGIIESYIHKYPEIKIIFTGGDVNYFDTTTKNNIFAVANLVLNGLNIILNYNAEN